MRQQVRSADGEICQGIASLDDDRGFLSQTILAQLRNLVEGLIAWAYVENPAAEFHYDQGSALDEVKAKAKFRLLSRFHNLLRASTSHYTLDGDPSERLILKYYEYLLRTRDLALKQPSPSADVPCGSSWPPPASQGCCYDAIPLPAGRPTRKAAEQGANWRPEMITFRMS